MRITPVTIKQLHVIFTVHRAAGLLAVVLSCLIVLAGCDAVEGGSADNDRAGSASPTPSITPAGEVLQIDDQPVRRVFIPDPTRGPLYALTDEALYIRNGAQWEPTGSQNDGRTFLVDPHQPDRIFRGGHPPCQAHSGTEAIMLEVSKDGGSSWLPLSQGQNIQPLAIDPTYPDIIYGSWCWLAISTTSGHTWMRLDLMENYPLSAIAISGKRLFVLGTSTDGWSRLRAVDITNPAQPLLGDILLEVSGVASLDARHSQVIVGAADGVHISSDGGATWTQSRVGLEAVTTTAKGRSPRTTADPTSNPLGIIVVHIEPSGARIFAGTAHGLFVSQDGGATWVRYTEVALDALVTEIQFDLSGADLYVTTIHGVIAIPAP